MRSLLPIAVLVLVAWPLAVVAGEAAVAVASSVASSPRPTLGAAAGGFLGTFVYNALVGWRHERDCPARRLVRD